jgi:hypothetical protein
LVEIITQLRGPNGCPWDQEQDLFTMRPYLLEETYEVLEAMEVGAQPTVLISVDGFNRAFYQDPGYHTPQLRRMASEGASAERVIPVFPSLTYPGHAVIQHPQRRRCRVR